MHDAVDREDIHSVNEILFYGGSKINIYNLGRIKRYAFVD